MFLNIKNCFYFFQCNPKPFFFCVVTYSMMIDNSIRKRWGLIPTQAISVDDNEVTALNESSQTHSPGLDMPGRFRVSAQEWLLTWRTVE